MTCSCETERWEDCRRCHGRVGYFTTEEERQALYRSHWPTCTGVESVSFHPDGSVATVTFR